MVTALSIDATETIEMIDMVEVCDWAREAGAIARSYFNIVQTGRRKADSSIVTQVDIEIEELLRERIQERYPDHGIMGEEQGIGAVDREYVWSLDPLDGTEAFVTGLPVWGVSIGLLRDGYPYLGVVYLPMSDECFWNDDNGVAYRNDDMIHVTRAKSLNRRDAIMVTSRAHMDYEISFPGKTRSMGSFAAHCCYVARGSVVGALLGYPQLWDIAAGMAILHAAGGVGVTIYGQPLDICAMLDGSKPDEPLVISTPALKDELIRCIQVK